MVMFFFCERGEKTWGAKALRANQREPCFVICFISKKSVGLHLSPKRSPADAENAGRLMAVSFCFFEGVFDGDLLVFPEVSSGGAVGFLRVPRPGVLQKLRQMRRGNDRAFYENKGMLQGMFQLSNISRPRIAMKQLQHLRIYTPYLFPILDVEFRYEVID